MTPTKLVIIKVCIHRGSNTLGHIGATDGRNARMPRNRHRYRQSALLSLLVKPLLEISQVTRVSSHCLTPIQIIGTRIACTSYSLLVRLKGETRPRVQPMRSATWSVLCVLSFLQSTFTRSPSGREGKPLVLSERTVTAAGPVITKLMRKTRNWMGGWGGRAGGGRGLLGNTNRAWQSWPHLHEHGHTGRSSSETPRGGASAPGLQEQLAQGQH